MPFFSRPGLSLHYQVVDGVLPHDALFLHGNLGSNLWWEPAIAEWKKIRSGETGRMILAEWRGCGESREFEGGLDLPTLSQDCNALLEHLGAKSVDLIGHSTGGLIGLHALAAEPARYRRALLLSPVAPEGIQFGPEMIEAFAQMSRDRDFCAAVILGTIHEGKLSEEFRQRIVDAAFGVSPKIWAGVPALLEHPPALPLGQFNQPILVAHGAHDGVLPIQKSEALAKALPQGKFVRLEERGHCANVEDPAAFVALADKFLKNS